MGRPLPRRLLRRRRRTMIRSLAEALGRETPASRYSPDMSRHAFLGTDAKLHEHNQRLRQGAVMQATGSHARPRRARWRSSTSWPPRIRARARASRRARRLPAPRPSASCGPPGCSPSPRRSTSAARACGHEGATAPYYELLEPLARIDSVTAQLLQVHSHALGIVAGLADARAAAPAAGGDRRRRPAPGLGRQRGQADRQARRHRAHRARGDARAAAIG